MASALYNRKYTDEQFAIQENESIANAKQWTKQTKPNEVCW